MNLPKTFHEKGKSREDEIYAKWLENGYFRATANAKNFGDYQEEYPIKIPYTIMMPPPNITGILHMGHALNITIQDILIRFKRMQGYETLYQPGTDHAAIATEVKVINALAKEGLTKESLGREEFLKRLWAWNDEFGGTIISQLKKLGASCDWDRVRFTMDDGLSEAVLEVFVRLYNEGKIYKGERLVNWCTKCETSISDAEVDHEDKEGHLYHFKYPVEGSDFISFATTRPETMLGDTAIAVHPKDSRYIAYIGKYATIPMLERKIPIIADNYVDPEYGTGVVKITPAHDPNDFEVGQRHNLPRINIMNDNGTINENGGCNYQGLSCQAARTKIIEEMTNLGLFIKSDKLTHAVGEHDRCGTTIEPLLKLQWFVRMEELAKPALEAYKSGKLKFNRDRFGKIYQHWLENIRDWCISRQLWWGHRIPAYYCPQGHITVSKSKPEKCSTCDSVKLVQDEDVLDTWFSSALWPFSTLGWPEKTEDLEYFYPTSTLVTANEILFTWVVRMMFSGIHFTGEIPFTNVFIHGIVRDSLGRKMSKSLDNGIDPLEIIEEYGADVLRLMLVSGNALDNDTRFFRERLDPARNVLNKLWNATKFVIMNLDGYDVADETRDIFAKPAYMKPEDYWIRARCNKILVEVTEKFEEHELGFATQKIVDFIWDEFCDWYVEMVKPRLYVGQNGKLTYDEQESRRCVQYVLSSVLRKILQMLHPIAPFITEELFIALEEAVHKTIPTDRTETLMLASWPIYLCSTEKVVRSFEEPYNSTQVNIIEMLQTAIKAVRNIRAERQVPPSQKIVLFICPDENSSIGINKDVDMQEIYSSCCFIAPLTGAKEVTIISANSTEQIPQGAISIVVPGATIYIPMDSLVDSEKEKARLTKEKEKLQKEIARIDGKLSNEGFMAKAPEHLINEERNKREKFATMLAKIEAELL